MADELFLIAHKVRGEPTFEIAIRSCSGELPCQPNCGLWNGETCMAREEDWWTVPTSGHSAYPYWHMPLSQVHFYGNSKMEEVLQSCPEDWRDHYAANNKGNLNLDDFGDMLTDDDEKKGTSLLESLGLLKKPTPITRRV